MPRPPKLRKKKIGNSAYWFTKMAGTNIARIERVYGHFRNEHLKEAQTRLDEARKMRRG